MASLDKKQARLRRARRTRAKIRELGVTRLMVHRTPRHIYAQVIDDTSGNTVAAASSQDEALRGKTLTIETAGEVGKLVAERAKEAGVSSVVFDRGGFKFHGRVKALADAAREAGLEV